MEQVQEETIVRAAGAMLERRRSLIIARGV